MIDVARFGAHPDSGQDATLAFQKALGEIAKYPRGATLRVPKGRYDFSSQNAAKLQILPSNLMDETGPHTVALDLQNHDNLTIDGPVFRGR